MVDKERRKTIKKLGIGGALLLGSGGATALYGDDVVEGWEAWQEERQERQERKRRKQQQEEERRRERMPEEWAEKVEADLKGELDNGDWYGWEGTMLDVDGMDATYEEVGTTSEGMTVYHFTVTAPLETDDIAVCDYDGDRGTELALAETLWFDAIKVYEDFYDVTGRYAAPLREPDRPQISAYTMRFTDDTGAASTTIDAEDAVALAGGDVLLPEDRDRRERFLQHYRAGFEVDCHG